MEGSAVRGGFRITCNDLACTCYAQGISTTMTEDALEEWTFSHRMPEHDRRLMVDLSYLDDEASRTVRLLMITCFALRRHLLSDKGQKDD